MTGRLYGIRTTYGTLTEKVNLCISIDPNVDLSAVEAISVHASAGAVRRLWVVEANHTTAL